MQRRTTVYRMKKFLSNPVQVQSATDIEALRNFLDDSEGEHIGIIAKIETVQGLKHFDEILVAVSFHSQI